MIKQLNFQPFKESLLIENFSYPKKFLDIAKSTSIIKYDNEDVIFPWEFYDSRIKESELITWKLRNNILPNFNLLPFAKNGDWQANFDGNDTSGNPRVIVVDLGDLPFHMIIKDFDEWLSLAEQDYW